MGTNYFTLISITIFLSFVTTTEMPSDNLPSVVSLFSAKFVNELDKNKSVVSSPLSAEILLALLTLATTDPSHKELLAALNVDNDQTIRSAFQPVSSKLNAVKGVTLNVANKVYIKEGDYDLAPEIKKDAADIFNAELEKVNFAASVAAAQLINGWVEKKTNNRIKDLLTPDSFNDDTRLVLVNAIYFKGNWKQQFKASNTRDEDFHIDARKTVKVPMMHQESNFNFGISEGLQAKLLEMPYVGGESSMLIILPDEVNGLDGVLAKLAGGYDLIGEIKSMFSTKVQVAVPKFKIETTIDLNELLPKIGIESIFKQNSGITKLLSNGERLTVSKAIQKAFIEVNEEGAEAAAATGMVMMLRCARPPSMSFVADHPFIFAILAAGEAEPTVLFIGSHRGGE